MKYRRSRLLVIGSLTCFDSKFDTLCVFGCSTSLETLLSPFSMDAEDALDSERYERYMDDFDWYPDHSDGEEDVSKLPSDDYMSFTDELDIKPGWSSQTVAEEMLKSVQESRRAFLRYCWSEMIDKYGMIGVVTAFPIVRQEAQSAIDRATLSTVYNASTGDGFSRGRGQGKKRGRGRGGLSFWTPPRSWPLSTSVRELVGFDDIDDTGGFDYDVLPQDGRIRAEVLQLIADQTVRLYMDRNKHCGKKHDLFVNNRPFQYFNSRSSENHFQCAASLLLGPEDVRGDCHRLPCTGLTYVLILGARLI